MPHYTFPADHDDTEHVSFPTVPEGKFLKDDGTWDAGGGGIVGDGVAKITVGTTAPVGPAIGDLWVDTN